MGSIVWLASYPKSGNTWTRIFMTNYLQETQEEADINALYGGPVASSRCLFDHAVGIEAACLVPEEVENLRPAVYRQLAREVKHTRFVKTHDAWKRTARGEPLFPADATQGVIYIVRHPLDVAASTTHHNGEPAEKIVAAMADETHTLAAPKHNAALQLPQEMRSWSSHVASWLDESGLRVHLMRYEDMLRDPAAAFRAALEFSGKDVDEARLATAAAASSFATLQRQENERGFREKPSRATAPFFRRGRAGAWREEIPADLARKIIERHGPMMRRLGYLDPHGNPTY